MNQLAMKIGLVNFYYFPRAYIVLARQQNSNKQRMVFISRRVGTLLATIFLDNFLLSTFHIACKVHFHVDKAAYRSGVKSKGFFLE